MRSDFSRERLAWVRDIYDQSVSGEISATEAERRIRLAKTGDYKISSASLPGVLIEDDNLRYVLQLLTDKRDAVALDCKTAETAAATEGRRFLIDKVIFEGELDRLEDLIEAVEARREYLCPECGASAPHACKMDCGTQKFRSYVHVSWGIETLCKFDVLDFGEKSVVPLADNTQHAVATCEACKTRLAEILRDMAKMDFPTPWEKTK